MDKQTGVMLFQGEGANSGLTVKLSDVAELGVPELDYAVGATGAADG